MVVRFELNKFLLIQATKKWLKHYCEMVWMWMQETKKAKLPLILLQIEVNFVHSLVFHHQFSVNNETFSLEGNAKVRELLETATTRPAKSRKLRIIFAQMMKKFAEIRGNSREIVWQISMRIPEANAWYSNWFIEFSEIVIGFNKVPLVSELTQIVPQIVPQVVQQTTTQSTPQKVTQMTAQPTKPTQQTKPAQSSQSAAQMQRPAHKGKPSIHNSEFTIQNSLWFFKQKPIQTLCHLFQNSLNWCKKKRAKCIQICQEIEFLAAIQLRLANFHGCLHWAIWAKHIKYHLTVVVPSFPIVLYWQQHIVWNHRVNRLSFDWAKWVEMNWFNCHQIEFYNSVILPFWKWFSVWETDYIDWHRRYSTSKSSNSGEIPIEILKDLWFRLNHLKYPIIKLFNIILHSTGYHTASKILDLNEKRWHRIDTIEKSDNVYRWNSTSLPSDRFARRTSRSANDCDRLGCYLVWKCVHWTLFIQINCNLMEISIKYIICFIFD